MQRQQAPFRADIVGSFLRPDSIKQARQQLAEGIIDAAQLRGIENNAIRHLVQQQCDCGLHVVTDGEFRRAWWHFDFFDGLQGVERYDAEQGIQFNGVQTKAHGVRVTGKLAFGDHPMLEDFRYSEKHQRRRAAEDDHSQPERAALPRRAERYRCHGLPGS